MANLVVVTATATFPELNVTLTRTGKASTWDAALSRAAKQIKKEIKRKRFSAIKMVIGVGREHGAETKQTDPLSRLERCSYHRDDPDARRCASSYVNRGKQCDYAAAKKALEGARQARQQ